MWCGHCQQDVPGVASQSDGQVRCARCRGTFSEMGRADEEPAGRRVDAPDPESSACWDFEADLDAAEELLGLTAARISERDSQQVSLRIDSAHHPGATSPNPSRRPPVAAGSKAWYLVSLGVTGCVCGGALLVWSSLGSRPELQTAALLSTLGGQAFLILGLVAQLDSLWRSHADAQQKLEAMNDDLAGLRHSASGPYSQSFYTHLAQGASPKTLLADLKGQLDLLSEHVRDAG